jgi:hypothetical protein
MHKSADSQQHEGLTDDLSISGIYLQSDTNMELGATVEFEITLPPEVTGGKKDVVIQGTGRVVRSDARQNGDTKNQGVACVIDHYEFVRNA